MEGLNDSSSEQRTSPQSQMLADNQEGLFGVCQVVVWSKMTFVLLDK